MTPTISEVLERAAEMVEPVAALYVEKGGCYFGLDSVDPWDEARDARLYAGPHPVVAHPPCQRWGKLWAGQPLFIKRTGIRKIKGDDDGCFAAALDAVRRWGGVLEHPWGSHAWAHFNLNKPPRSGGWISAELPGSASGWTCCVEQGRYGHYARKPTLLIAYHCDLPELDWGIGESRLDPAIIERMGLKRAKRLGEVGGRGGGTDSAPRIGTPEPFRDLLLSIARTAKPPRHISGVSNGSDPVFVRTQSEVVTKRGVTKRCSHTATYSDEKLAEIVANYRAFSHHQVILAMREIEHRRSS